jgi:hypothetical protein
MVSGKESKVSGIKKPVLIHNRNKYRLMSTVIPTVGREPALPAERNIYDGAYRLSIC